MGEELFDRAEFVAYFRDETDELLQQLDADLLAIERLIGSGEAGAEIVNSLFRALHTVKGSAAMLRFDEVSNLAHKLENLCGLLREASVPLTAECVDLLFTGRDYLTDLVAVAVGGGEPRAGLKGFAARLEALAQSHVEPLSEIAKREMAKAPGATEMRDLRKAQRAAHETIRVDIARLDALLNLVGELVINRTRISNIAATFERSLKSHELAPLTKELAESAATLARTSGEIQDSIVKVRMVPLGQVFDRFPRLVRDVAKAGGKDVRLQIAGGQTELDKTIVDEIGKPLMHLLRNCVDHGIETPDVREARGKPRTGTVCLNAFHEGNQVIVEIADDGSGIDLERVRARAIADGLIGEHGRLSDREIVELIFTPGLSTAQSVSDVSGRGVGMDAVKKNVARLKGSLEVDTRPGTGTTFTIKLPLTLAIIQALLVRVEEELYSVPLDSVIESQRVDRSEVRTVHGNEVIQVRGRVVPLVQVAEFFGLGEKRDAEKVKIVIVGVQGRQAGLVVDSFEGEQEIVIKPLSDVVGRIAGISGATILGNGAVSLIVDVHSLISEVA